MGRHEHQLGQKRRPLVPHKLLERNWWTAEQPGDCVRDSRRRAAGEVTEQFVYRSDVPFGHSRFAHPVRRGRERHVHVLNIPAKNRRQLFSDLVKSQSFRSGDDVGLSFVTGSGEYLCGHGTDVADVHRALRGILEGQIERALLPYGVDGGEDILMKRIRLEDRERYAGAAQSVVGLTMETQKFGRGTRVGPHAGDAQPRQDCARTREPAAP